jgi:hypothetical protein
LRSPPDGCADAGLRVVFELLKGDAHTLAVRFTHTIILADKCGERDGFGRGERGIPPGAVLHLS